jgi:hypothetical protein
LRSTSKIPPEFVETAPEVGGVSLDEVDAFGFHGAPVVFEAADYKARPSQPSACSIISCTRRVPFQSFEVGR